MLDTMILIKGHVIKNLEVEGRSVGIILIFCEYVGIDLKLE